MRRTPLVSFSALAALGTLAMAASPLLAAPARSAGAPALIAGRGEARIALASGERVAFPLPPGAELTAVAGSGQSWFAAGTRPVRGSGGRSETRREILLVTERGGTAVPLAPPPAVGAARMRQEPMPLADGGRLTGLAWLEGDDVGRLVVRFAPREEEGWGEVETVAGRGPGSQIGLAAAPLAGGSLVLAWSAFDGEDNEILWAVRSADGTWSRPRRVAGDNDVPDVIPALVASRDGALLVWNRYDGEGYEVVSSRLRGGSWSAPRQVAPSGSIFPTLDAEPAAAGGARLLYQTAVPGGWGFAQLDAAGRAVRRATIADPGAGPGRERPQALPGRDGVRFVREGAPARLAPWRPASGSPASRTAGGTFESPGHAFKALGRAFKALGRAFKALGDTRR